MFRKLIDLFWFRPSDAGSNYRPGWVQPFPIVRVKAGRRETPALPLPGLTELDRIRAAFDQQMSVAWTPSGLRWPDYEGSAARERREPWFEPPAALLEPIDDDPGLAPNA